MKKLNLQRVPSKDSRRGAVLLVAMGILALLAIFAITFANLVSLEKSASRNYVDSIRARMIARAGLERAIAELRSVAETKTHDDTRPLVAGGDPWIYRQRYSGAFLGLSTTPQVSFPMSDNVYRLQQKDANGRPLSTTTTFVSSGRLGASYANGMDAYRLKILDCASMIYVNGRDTVGLERMLKNLLIAHGLNAADAESIAIRVRTRRPGAGYRTKSELGMVMKQSGGSPFVTDALWPDVRDDLTCFAWQDNKVIAPPRAQTIADDTSTVVPPARLNLTERAPVNMNTASEQVLTAIIAELSARRVTFTRTYNGSTATKTPSTTNTTISFAEAQNLARAIVLRREGSGTTTSTEVPGGPFKSWFEFECWLDSNTTWATGANKALKADLVRAMANPNTDIVLHKWGLEGNHIFRWAKKTAGAGNIAFVPTEPREIDKSDLTAVTTEMCFSSMGFFEITSLGQVWNSGSITNPGQPNQQITLSETVAENSLTSVVQVFNVLRLTTQRDFERDREYLDPKLYLKYNDGSTGSVSGFTDLASEKGDWPATLTQPEYSNKHNVPDIGATSTTSTSTSSGADFFTLSPDYEPAVYDGQIILNGLARIKATDPDFLCGYARGKLKPLKVRYYENDVARWSNPTPSSSNPGRDIEADRTAGRITESDSVRNQATKVRLLNSEPTPKRSLLNPGGNVNDLFFGAGLTNLGVMLTDDRERYLVYSGNNLDLRQGTIHFWVKPLRSSISTDKEVYFSWLGGSTNNGKRDCGIEIFKERNLNQIDIVARFYGLNGGLKSTDDPTIRFPVGFINGSKLTEGSFWKPGQWNHIQLAFGVNTLSANPQYTANLIVNSQEMGGGPQEVSKYTNGLGVRHGYVLSRSPPPFVEPATTTALRGTGKRGVQFFWPWLPYDYYYCDAGGTSSSQVTVTRTLNALRNPNSHGNYMPSVLPKLNFPPNVTDKEVIINFLPGPHTPEGAVPPSPVNASPPQDPYDASVFPVTSETVPGPGEHFYNPTQDVRNNKWKLEITLKWKETVESKGSVCPDCRNCQDCSAPIDKDPTAYQGSVNYHCFNRFPVSQGANTIGECDDCEGCEACDVDGPIFIGAELFYTGLTPVSNNVLNTNIDTDGVFHFSQALIDNLYLLGYRVDEELNAVNEVPSDRFYDQDVAKVNSNNANGRGHKPGYKKLLTDLYGRQFKLGTVSWTGYPGYSRVEASIGGQLDPSSLLPVTITIQKWNFGLNAQSQTIDYVTGDTIQPGFLDGIMSSNPTITNTNVNPLPGYQPLNSANADDPDRGGVGLSPQLPAFRKVDSQDILILSVDFAPNLIAANTVSQTPVLDDVTITYFTTPKIIYTEEGVDE
ncbi:MAG: hypothetical protein P1V97_17435 [Planctomycetota bacterium]|nr:hypothetical protein [Planctomycetota bacterium]